MSHVSLLLIDRSKLFREGMKRVLAETRFHVCGEAANSLEAHQLLNAGLTPDIVLIDLSLSTSETPIDWSHEIRELLGEQKGRKLVVLTSEMSPRRLVDALAAGADGFLLKDMSPDALSQSLQLVMLGEKVFPAQVIKLSLSDGISVDHDQSANGSPPIRGLSDREVIILRCLLHGLSNKHIAKRLEITEGTAKVHLKSILKKINVRNRTQAAIWALKAGLNQASSAHATPATAIELK